MNPKTSEPPPFQATIIVPFVSRLAPDQQKLWCDTLTNALPQVVFKRFAELTPTQRQTSTIAVVADPDSNEVKLLPRLQWVHSVWAGVDSLQTLLKQSQLPIIRLVDPTLSSTMAEAVLAWTLYLHRGMPQYARQQIEAIWQQHTYVMPQDRLVAILGMGQLGTASAARLSSNQFEVIGWRRSAKSDSNPVKCYHGQQGLLAVLEQADILINLLPLTTATRHLLNRDTLAQLKPGCGLINFGRGETVDYGALVDSIEAGIVDHAILDVFPQEPLPHESILWKHPRITILPHISAPTNMHSAAKIVANNIETYLKDGSLPQSVDPIQGY